MIVIQDSTKNGKKSPSILCAEALSGSRSGFGGNEEDDMKAGFLYQNKAGYSVFE